ncbi:hypothetical protein ACFQL0_13855 [Haloplanus litoreus]|uniref:DUF7847 domain-containing protein n=1 Tax=Haloplanus litoreus TaxID=767515 RepID=UPI003605AF43
MSAIRALRTAVDALTGGPVLVFGGLLYALVVLPQQALQLAGVPLVPSLLQMLTFFLTPFVVAGVVGVARTALDGAASFDSFTAVGAKRYVDLLLATFVEFGIKLAFGIGFVVLGFLLLAVAGSSGPAALVGLFVVAAVAVAHVLVLFGIQFYPVVVVLDDAGPVDAVTESVAFVRSNVVSTLGFSAITVLLGTLAALPFVGPAVYRFATTDPTSTGGGPDRSAAGCRPAVPAPAPRTAPPARPSWPTLSPPEWGRGWDSRRRPSSASRSRRSWRRRCFSASD